jgi:hypothetical protein
MNMKMCDCDNPKMFYWNWEGAVYAACSNCNTPMKPPPILTRYGKKLRAQEKEDETRQLQQSEQSIETDSSGS